MPEQFARSTLGLAAEYAVASELCRRGIYTQLTLGHQKRTDLLVFSESGGLARIEVKAKQGRDWPNCRGICGQNVFIVFVDFQDRNHDERPTFFILSPDDWRHVLQRRVDSIQARNPTKRITITEENVAIFEDQIGPTGKPYQGMGIRAADLDEFRGCWTKIAAAISAG